jgi:hypothetical protein
MPGPQSKPAGGKTYATKGKPAHPNREALGKGMHKPGSQNRNKNGR